MSATRQFPHYFTGSNEAAESLGDDNIIDESAIFAGGARDVPVRGPHDFETQAFQDAGGFKGVSGNVPVARRDHHPPAVVGSIGDTAEDVDIEVPNASTALAVYVGHDDGGCPPLEPKSTPDASWIVGDAVVVFSWRELYADVFPRGGDDAGGELNIFDNRR